MIGTLIMGILLIGIIWLYFHLDYKKFVKDSREETNAKIAYMQAEAKGRQMADDHFNKHNKLLAELKAHNKNMDDEWENIKQIGRFDKDEYWKRLDKFREKYGMT